MFDQILREVDKCLEDDLAASARFEFLRLKIFTLIFKYFPKRLDVKRKSILNTHITEAWNIGKRIKHEQNFIMHYYRGIIFLKDDEDFAERQFYMALEEAKKTKAAIITAISAGINKSIHKYFIAEIPLA